MSSLLYPLWGIRINLPLTRIVFIVIRVKRVGGEIQRVRDWETRQVLEDVIEDSKTYFGTASEIKGQRDDESSMDNNPHCWQAIAPLVSVWVNTMAAS
mgnify:CR=1 FL=1